MSFLEHFNALHPHIKDYVYFQWSVREEMNGKDIIGWKNEQMMKVSTSAKAASKRTKSSDFYSSALLSANANVVGSTSNFVKFLLWNKYLLK